MGHDGHRITACIRFAICATNAGQDRGATIVRRDDRPVDRRTARERAPLGVRPAPTTRRQLGNVSSALLARARREAIGGVPDAELQTLRAELSLLVDERRGSPMPTSPVIDVEFIIDGTIHRYFSTITTLGTIADGSLQEFRVELFHPH
jgi:hypothetical protein